MRATQRRNDSSFSLKISPAMRLAAPSKCVPDTVKNPRCRTTSV
jgi:hypothetical protein